MMKRILLFLILTVLPLALYAQTSLEVSVSPAFNIASFITDKASSISVDTSEDIAKGFAVSASILHEIYPWLSAGGTAYADTRSLIGKDGAFITIPFMAALRFSYPGEGIEIPLTIMAGGHAQGAGDLPPAQKDGHSSYPADRAAYSWALLSDNIRNSLYARFLNDFPLSQPHGRSHSGISTSAFPFSWALPPPL